MWMAVACAYLYYICCSNAHVVNRAALKDGVLQCKTLPYNNLFQLCFDLFQVMEICYYKLKSPVVVHTSKWENYTLISSFLIVGLLRRAHDCSELIRW